MTAVQQMLNNLNEGRVQISDDMIDATLNNIKAEMGIVDVSSAKKMDLERELIESEYQNVAQGLVAAQDDLVNQLETLTAEENALLKGCTDEEERQAIMAKYNALRDDVKNKLANDRDAQMRAIQLKLAQRRKLQQKKMENEFDGLPSGRKTDDDLSKYLDGIQADIDHELNGENAERLEQEIDLLKQSHSDHKEKLQALFFKQVHQQISEEDLENFEKDLAASVPDIENGHFVRRDEELKNFHQTNENAINEAVLKMKENGATDEEISAFREHEKVIALVALKGVIHGLNEQEVNDLQKNYQRLIEKYGKSADSLLDEFNLQTSQLNEAKDLEKQRQLRRIKERMEKRRMDKLRQLEQNQLGKAMADIELNDATKADNALTKEHMDQLNLIVDQQSVETEELEQKISQNENKEDEKLQKGMILPE